MRARPSNVLIVVVAKIFLSDGSLCGHRVVQIIDHLVLRARLYLERANSTLLLLLLMHLRVEIIFLPLQLTDALFQTVILGLYVIHFRLERTYLFLPEAE